MPSATRLTVLACAAFAFAYALAPPGAHADARSHAAYAPGVVLVKYATATAAHTREATARAAGAADPVAIAAHTRLLRLRPGVPIGAALARLRRRRDVLWAVPDYTARTSEALIPNDPGNGPAPGDWQQLQWNFSGAPGFGVNAPEAWAHLAAAGARGGRGVVVAVLDTGIAYANRGPFVRSPDFTSHQFVAGYDFVDHDPYANDRNGHGTHVAGTIAEATGNNLDLTGLAYGVRLMPVRVLDREGEGDASVIASGVRFAVNHGARVINLSLEFSSEVTASDIPELLEALRYAHRRGVVVVAAAGNEGRRAIAYPARAPNVISVGAITEHGCLASFSNDGRALTLVAPGGGPDADLPGDPNCHPELPAGRDIYQETFVGSSYRRFGMPSGYDGTSMATPHVAATAALIIASRVLGSHPTPAQILARLRATARRLGDPSDAYLYGAGLVDAGAATAPGGPGAVH
ncbi:MAG TPA: S8 family serine peptidase [Solirubrobacteraceae bacterium]|jgi:serine protease